MPSLRSTQSTKLCRSREKLRQATQRPIFELLESRVMLSTAIPSSPGQIQFAGSVGDTVELDIDGVAAPSTGTGTYGTPPSEFISYALPAWPSGDQHSIKVTIESVPAKQPWAARLTVFNGSEAYYFNSYDGTAVNETTIPIAGRMKVGAVYTATVVAGMPKLVVTQQPANTIAGVAIPTIKVAVEDAGGTIETLDNTSITLGIKNNTGNVALSGTLTEQVINGVATFSGLQISKAGTYTLQAVDGSYTSATSSSFKISAAAASKLAFATTPIGTIAGKNLAAFKVDVEDQFGNIVTTNTSKVTLATKTGPGAVFGTASVNAVAGVATFGAVNFHAAGSYTLGATDTGLAAAVSGSFAITHAAVAHLVFVQNPKSVIAGANIAPAITVKATDAFGNIVSGASVKLAIGSGPVGGALFGAITATTAATGIATFSGVSLHLAGTYTLAASDGAIVSPKSTAFTVSAAKASKLVFTTLPVGSKHGVAFTVKVSVQDVYGNVLIADSTGTITLALATHPAGSTLGGTLTANVVKGVATFSNLTVSLAGTYSLKASDSFALAAVTSGSIVVS